MNIFFSQFFPSYSKHFRPKQTNVMQNKMKILGPFNIEMIAFRVAMNLFVEEPLQMLFLVIRMKMRKNKDLGN